MTDLVGAPKLDWEPFRCELLPERDAVRVKPVGELDLATVGQVAHELDELSASGFRTVLLDLAALTFIDSSGIRMILNARKAAARDGIALTVLPGPPPVQRSFELTGVAGLIFT